VAACYQQDGDQHQWLPALTHHDGRSYEARIRRTSYSGR
jgi:hypothetical protein